MRVVLLALFVLLALSAMAAARSHKKSRNARMLHRYMAGPLPTDNDYQAKPAAEKANILWDLINKPYPEPRRTYATVPQSLPVGTLVSGAIQGFGLSFSTASDSMPKPVWSTPRYKFIHPLGSVAKISWQKQPAADVLKLTGLFAEEEVTGFVRLGWAANPESKTPPSAVPGVAVKLMRDGRPSSNFMVMYGLEGQGNEPNFFVKDFTNHLPDPRDKTVIIGGKLFVLGTGTPFASRLGVHTMSEIDAKGNNVANPVGVWKLIFKPEQAVAEAYGRVVDAQADKFETRDALHALYNPEEHVTKPILWKVFAVPFPHEQNEDDVCQVLSDSVTKKKPEATLEYTTAMEKAGEHHIANVVMETSFVSSEYGDDHLFFQHEFFCRKQLITSRFPFVPTVQRLWQVATHTGNMASLPEPDLEEDDEEQDWSYWQALW